MTSRLFSVFPKVPPSPELVKRVRDLYHKRLPDVRFLIPVLNGLEKVGKEEGHWSARFHSEWAGIAHLALEQVPRLI